MSVLLSTQAQVNVHPRIRPHGTQSFTAYYASCLFFIRGRNLAMRSTQDAAVVVHELRYLGLLTLLDHADVAVG